jgi:hypothetical protein
VGPRFEFRKILHLIESTGASAATLDELLRAVNVVEARSIGYHMHREFLAHKFVHTGWPNDFALWSANVVGDRLLAERLAQLVVSRYRSLEAVRAELARQIAEHLIAHADSSQGRVPDGREFRFASARSVVMSTGAVAHDLASFADALARVPSSSIHYHLFETRFSEDRVGDFSAWIDQLGFPSLAHAVAEIDPYMYSLDEARRRLLALVTAELR